ncbi:hypothetical protein Pan44_26980 [Caulifigura coniformis]|uniref:DUF3987 domain-containing protein n=1 Tax=Caulifigura coniformis TaxID=2527983 RepID=A0A517SEU5_9PLAN|nr:YfjI family protein [Caulifigura coniformis]QDT54663.1 hypothetical protein Pan44_26980 [Caulifigura coniformis]
MPATPLSNRRSISPPEPNLGDTGFSNDSGELLDTATERLRYQRFPCGALPGVLARFVTCAAKAIGCDPSLVALPVLAAVATAIGASRRLTIKSGWKVPSIIWATVVGESGSSKTPAYNAAMRPLFTRHARAIRTFEDERAKYEEQVAWWEKRSAEWKREKKSLEQPPEKPTEPTLRREIVSDITIEALAVVMKNSPRGVLLGCDELSAMFGSFGRYKSGGGGNDASHYLSMYSGQSITVDRRTSTPPTLFVPHASLSICGGIQPGILKKSLGSEHIENGLAARFLLAMPPRRPKVWTEDDIPSVVEQSYERLIDKLFALEGQQKEDGSIEPRLVYLTPEAKTEWMDYYNSHGAEQVQLSGALAAAWSKLEETAARLALIFHMVRVASKDPTIEHPDRVDPKSVQSAIRLVSWFKNEARRVYGKLTQGEEAAARDRLIELIEKQGGSIAPWRLAQLKAGCSTEDAKILLQSLVKRGIGRWEWIEATRGPSAREFVLSHSDDLGEGDIPNESDELLDADGLDVLPDELDDSEYLDTEVF